VAAALAADVPVVVAAAVDAAATKPCYFPTGQLACKNSAFGF
jgi:hypothetical protein